MPRVTETTTRRLMQRDERQAQILAAAAAAFARTGFAGTSMDDVAAEAGITRLIVYRHFDSKEDLYRAVLTKVTDRLGRGVAARACSAPTGAASCSTRC